MHLTSSKYIDTYIMSLDLFFFLADYFLYKNQQISRIFECETIYKTSIFSRLVFNQVLFTPESLNARLCIKHLFFLG